MAHRLVPLVQPPSVPLSDTWRNNWRIIDESFEIIVDGLTKELGKKIGGAIVEFVKAKFDALVKSRHTGENRCPVFL